MTLARPHVLSLIALALALATAGAARAQVDLPPPDSAVVFAEQGRDDGRHYAGRPGTGGYFAGGFVSGLPVGFFGLPAGIGREPAFVAVSLAGVAGGIVTLGSAERPTRVLPPQLERWLAERGPVYGEAFRQAYSARLSERRRRAAMVGGLAGTGVGFALLLHVLSSHFT